MTMHPSTQCWCGHSVANHTDRTRTVIDRCRGHGCPCSTFRVDGDPIRIGDLNDLLVGLDIAFSCVIFQCSGTVRTITHHDGRTTLDVDQGHHNMSGTFNSNIMCNVTINWPEEDHP